MFYYSFIVSVSDHSDSNRYIRKEINRKLETVHSFITHRITTAVQSQYQEYDPLAVLMGFKKEGTNFLNEF